ncbi:hypothetical protein PI124_g6192 [Phytophthora idaei]|nr:hypothetical protein PI125_g19680 [Phytophthora idaei]KAG3134404.1 hypothetical protein PI126_g18704 [Phytophthora idaei]KAG3249130.1 hypothetical protein PI124_g6192 [Phytophthora idaei]
MDLSYAEDEEAELLATEQRVGIRRRYTCGSSRRLRPSYPVRNQRKASPSQPAGSSRGKGDSQRPTGEYLSSVSLRGQRATGLSPEES